MPHEPTATVIHLNSIVDCLTPAIPLLNELNDSFGAPFLQAISNTTLSLITGVQKVKRNKEECVQLMENIHVLLYAIVNLHIKSETGGSLPPTTLDHIGKFTETLHKIHRFVEMQQDGSKIRHFFRQNEISALLGSCHEGLQQALEVFRMDANIFSNIAEMQKTAEGMHIELLELLSTLSNGTASDRSSSIYRNPNGSSSNSFSMLPSKPKIFHGRESELQDIVNLLNQESPRIAILGAGGMGKTSLARAALHHPDVASKYKHHFFVACDSANNSIGIAGLLGVHLELKPGKDLTKPVLRYFSRRPYSLLILDNLETAWEPKESRGHVEEFLSLLADIEHLALIITLRGAERPAKVRWTRPFIPPLEPLTDDAAWQTFVDIAEDYHPSEDINHLLHFTDNMPLAVDLIAHLVNSEGCSNVLTRWKREKTSLLSQGHDKRSSLDASIALSLSSFRMNSLPGTKELLSLLSILPDGLSDIELLQSKLYISDILTCKAILLRTSMAYIDNNKRLKSLVPIREYVLKFHPPSADLIEPLQKHFYLLLDLYQRYSGQMQMASKIHQITSNLGNLQQILHRELHPDSGYLLDAIECTILLNSFRRITGHGWLELMDTVPRLLPQLDDHRLEAKFMMETFQSVNHHPISELDLLVTQIISRFHNLNDPVLEANFYGTAGYYYYFSKQDLSTAMQFLEKALRLARSSGNTAMQSHMLGNIAEIKWMTGDYVTCWTSACEAQRLAQASANCFQETTTLQRKAVCCGSLGDYNQSITLLERGRELLKLCGLSGSTSDLSIIIQKAQIHSLKSEYVQAQSLHTQTLQHATAEHHPYIYAFALLNIAEINVLTGAYKAEVHQNLNNAMQIFQLHHSPASIYCKTIFADLDLRDGNTVAAKTQFQECFDLSWGKMGDAVSYCLERFADISRWSISDFEWSSRWTVVYLGHAKTTRKKLELYKALQFLGDVFLFNQDEETAHSLFIVALEGFTSMDVHRSQANCMLRLGDLVRQRGQMGAAMQFWRNARPLFEKSSQTQDVAQIDARLGVVDQEHQKTLAHLASLNPPIEQLDSFSIGEHLDNVRTEKVQEEKAKPPVAV
ncbi:hypothetical protein FB451DRAFT_1164474 [Mycena latifolia]|nr:hypothetical protein FB451DRAFT_1164474 [Mycena latifolia]